VDRDEAGGEERFINRQACLDDIRILLNSLSVERIQSLPLSCEDDIFLDALLNACKNEVSSYQHFVATSKSKTKNKQPMPASGWAKKASAIIEKIIKQQEKSI